MKREVFLEVCIIRIERNNVNVLINRELMDYIHEKKILFCNSFLYNYERGILDEIFTLN